MGFPVDWCARVTAVGNQFAQVKARKQARQLAGQYDEHGGDAAGTPLELSDADDGFAEFERLAPQLQSLFAAAEYGLVRLTDGQAALGVALLPGSATPQPARDYTQYLLPRDVASDAPFAGHDIGEESGSGCQPAGIARR